LIKANHATVKLDLSVAYRGIKTYSEELNCEMKMMEKSSQFLSSDEPSEPITLDVALNIARVEKYARKTCDCGQP